jgi:hypothetical protein
MKTKQTKPNHRSRFVFTFPPLLPTPSHPLTFLFFCFLLSLSGASATTRYVDVNSPSPTPPYTSWPTAATNIQDAIDAAGTGDLVLVTNGFYQAGGRPVEGTLLTNRVTVTNLVTVRSVNGPLDTVIVGYHTPSTITGDTAVRCAYLANGATLIGFTLSGGATRTIGGGWSDEAGGNAYCASWSEVISNCVIVGGVSESGGGGVYSGTIIRCQISSNSVIGGRLIGGGVLSSKIRQSSITYNVAPMYGGGCAACSLEQCVISSNTGGIGGGMSGGSATNCVFTRNRAGVGGGVAQGTLVNCTIVGNIATGIGGGVSDVELHNSIAYYNSAPKDPDVADTAVRGGTMDYSCTPQLSGGIGNITNAPLFVDYADGNLRLQANSPCINTGNNAYVVDPTDFDGRPRIVGGTVDMGAYEFKPNLAPMADASASRLLYVSSNGLDATVVLDGSRSSDPDGDALDYLWLSAINSQPSTFLADGVVAVAQLPVGVHPILLVVNDGLATATNVITVEVITTAQAVQHLIAQVESGWRRSRPLVATLSAALHSIERGNTVTAINQLRAFQSQVRAQVSPSDSPLAARCIQMAQEIIDVLSGGHTNPGGRPHGRFTALKHQPNGHVQLQFTAERGAVYLLEASTNLVHWEKIGVATDRGVGTFVFDDPDAARFLNRFYRIVSP